MKLKALTESEIVQWNGKNNMYTFSSDRPIEAIVIHYSTSLSSEKGSARNSANWFNNALAECSADYIVDDEEIVQYNCAPKRKACWSVGGPPYVGSNGASLYGEVENRNSISVEMSSTNVHKNYMPEANDPSWSITDNVLNSTIRLVRYLMKKYKIGIEKVIRHYDVVGKWCPGVIGWNLDSGSEVKWHHFLYCVQNGVSWDTEEKSTAKTMYTVQVGAFENKSYATKMCTELRQKGYSDAFVAKKEV